VPFSACDKLGPYEILAKIGAGGMGERCIGHEIPGSGETSPLRLPPSASATALIVKHAPLPP
jgi:hypothetical protein